MGTAEKKDDKVIGNSENAEAKEDWKAPMITLDDDEPQPGEGEGEGDDEGKGGDDNTPAADGSESQDGDTDEGDGQEGDGDDDDQQQIVREGDNTQSQPTTPRGFLKRINKLNGKVGEAQEGEATQKDRADFLEQENQVQKTRIQQLEGAPPPQPLERPDVNKFDGGMYDPKYQQAVDDYNDKRQDARFTDRLAEQTKKSSVTDTQAALAQKLRQKQEAHIERATKLKVKDYEATEDIAISIMGHEKVNHIILALPDRTEQLVYYLGKNPKVAQKYGDMLETETVRALMELGGILSEIKVKPVSKKSLKDPDEDLAGGNLPTGKKKRGPKGATFA
jgi:hypothetical protein